MFGLQLAPVGSTKMVITRPPPHLGWAVCAAVWTKKGDHRRVHRHASAVSQCGGHGAVEGRDRLRQIPRAAARQRRARRRAPPRILSGGRGHARARSRETLAVAATLKDRPRVEAPRTPNLVRRESPPVQSVRAAGATRSVVDLQAATRRVEFPERLDQRAPLATPAGDGSPRRVALPSYRWHRRV